MADPTSAAGANTQAAGANAAPAATGAVTPPATDNGGGAATTPQGRTYTDADMAAARHRWESEAAEAANKAKLQAQGDLQKLLDLEASRAKTLEEQLRSARTQVAGRDLAATVGIRADRAAQALTLINSQIDYDKDGNPTNLDALLKKLLKDTPEWAATTTPAVVSAGAGTNVAKSSAAGGATSQTFSRSQLADRAFWTANQPAIMTAIREGRITDD